MEIEIEAKDVRRAAMDLLARREHSFKELQDKLFIRFQKARKRAQSFKDKSKIHEGAEETVLEETGLESTDPIQSEDDIQSLIDQEIKKLRSEGLQSDARLAEAYLRARSNRGHGPLKISVELRQKGVMEQLIDKAFGESEIDWVAKVREVSFKKFGDAFPQSENESESESGLDPKLNLKLRAKRERFLMQRGFSYDLIALIDS